MLATSFHLFSYWFLRRQILSIYCTSLSVASMHKVSIRYDNTRFNGYIPAYHLSMPRALHRWDGHKFCRGLKICATSWQRSKRRDYRPELLGVKDHEIRTVRNFTQCLGDLGIFWPIFLMATTAVVPVAVRCKDRSTIYMCNLEMVNREIGIHPCFFEARVCQLRHVLAHHECAASFSRGWLELFLHADTR